MKTITYDKLVLATGSDFVCPEFDGDDWNNIYRLSNIMYKKNRVFMYEFNLKKV